MKNDKIMNRWLAVLGTLMIIPSCGAVYAWSIYRDPLAQILSEHMAVTADSLTPSLNFVFSLVIVFFAIGALPGGMLQDKIGPKKVAIAGGALLCLGMIFSSFATNVTWLYIFYGIVSGLGIGFAYMVPLATCNKWFPDKRGLISGVGVAGMGLGTIIFTPIGQALISNVGPLVTMRILGVVFFLLVTIGAQWMVVPPLGYKPSGWQPNELQKNVVNYTQKEMMRTAAFPKIWIIFMLGCAAGLMMIGQASPIGQQLAGLTVVEAAAIVGVLGIFNGLGRIFWGFASDKLGRMNTIAVVSGITGIAMLSFSIISSAVPFAIAISIVTLCFGGYMALFPAVTADFYGVKYYGGNYGIIYLGWGAAAIVGGWIGTAFSFQTSFYLAAALSGICVLLSLLTKKPVIVLKPIQEEVSDAFVL
ncbi:L-lactate MFS transporter [Liberiplasma polymorphum]|uniref:L-lactate MFS transporter n=1 Tax=Liberiplasma polymorphum TaxID=3374570 RepID=UPI0037739042